MVCDTISGAMTLRCDILKGYGSVTCLAVHTRPCSQSCARGANTRGTLVIGEIPCSLCLRLTVAHVDTDVIYMAA